VLPPDSRFDENVCTINGFPNANGIDTHNGAPVVIPPPAGMTALVDAGSPITVKGPAGTRTIVKRVAGALFDYPGVTFGDTSPGNYYDSGHYTVTASGGKDVTSLNGSTDVPSPQFTWTNMPDPKQPIDRTQDLIIKWTGGTPGTQVTAVGGSDVSGVNIGFLCAAATEAGTMTIPSYVLLNLPPTGSSPVPGQLTVGSRFVSVFTAPGLDWLTVAYAVDYTLRPKWQ
jgi:hypothetical protein